MGEHDHLCHYSKYLFSFSKVIGIGLMEFKGNCKVEKNIV